MVLGFASFVCTIGEEAALGGPILSGIGHSLRGWFMAKVINTKMRLLWGSIISGFGDLGTRAIYFKGVGEQKGDREQESEVNINILGGNW